jgi:hypothetical protein
MGATLKPPPLQALTLAPLASLQDARGITGGLGPAAHRNPIFDSEGYQKYSTLQDLIFARGAKYAFTLK